jgi:hypothetical protein
MKRVVVILVDWNGEEVTRECLASLKQVELPVGVKLSVVLIDNGSVNPISSSIVSEHLFITLLRSETNLGFTGGNNLGIEQALLEDPDYILFLNNDTVVRPDFLRPLLHQLEANPQVAAVQPKICFYPDQSLIWNAGNKFYPWITQTGVRGYGKLNKETDESVQEQPWLTGCAILARVDLFKGKQGLRFNDRFFALYEDVDLSFRIRKTGGKLLYIPSSVIYHHAGYSSNTKVKTKEGYTHPFMVFLNSRNRIWLARLYTPFYYWPTTFLFLFAYFLLLIPYFLLRVRFNKAFLVIKAIKEGILTKPV